MAKSPSGEKSLVENEELTKKFAEEAGTYFGRFKSQRDELDSLRQVMDYMYACAQNRTIAVSESGKGANLDKDTRANLSSTVFHRQVNTLAGRLVAVCKSKPDLFRYTTLKNPEQYASGLEGLDRAAGANMLVRWGLKEAGFYGKLPEFAVHIYKYSNVYALVQQHQEVRRTRIVEPVYGEVGVTTQEDGTEIPEIGVVGEKVTYKEKVVRNYPEFSFPHVDKIYLDQFVPTIDSQSCILILSLRNLAEINTSVKSKWFSQDAYDKIKAAPEKYAWDGTVGADLLTKEHENRDQTFDAHDSGLFVQWDVLMYSPIDGGEWDEENDLAIHWGSFIGNSLDDAVCMRLEANPDPDGEFPLKDVHVLPDKSDTMNHTTVAEVVRSAYSTLCTLMGLAVDNGALVNDPPVTILDGYHRISDFTFKKGARWHVDRHDAVKQLEVRDVTQTTSALIELVEMEIKRALATDPAWMGEYAGARTSASEFLEVNKNSAIPLTMQVDYVLNQLLPWMARKFMSYAEKYMPPQQVFQITDRNKEYTIRLGDVVGEYDVVVDLVQDYISDLMAEQKLNNIMQVVASTPYFQQSPTHTLDAGKFLKVMCQRQHVDADEFIGPPAGVDAEQVAYHENQAMLAGVILHPVPGENMAVHLKVHETEILRWKGLADTGDTRAINAMQILVPHAEETRMAMKQAAAPQAPAAPLGQGNQTPGEVQGNQVAGLLGAGQ